MDEEYTAGLVRDHPRGDGGVGQRRGQDSGSGMAVGCMGHHLWLRMHGTSSVAKDAWDIICG